jgi:hypothetical protein
MGRAVLIAKSAAWLVVGGLAIAFAIAPLLLLLVLLLLVAAAAGAVGFVALVGGGGVADPEP